MSRACFQDRWNGRLARTGRRPADRNGKEHRSFQTLIAGSMRLAIPPGESPDATGRWHCATDPFENRPESIPRRPADRQFRW